MPLATASMACTLVCTCAIFALAHATQHEHQKRRRQDCDQPMGADESWECGEHYSRRACVLFALTWTRDSPRLAPQHPRPSLSAGLSFKQGPSRSPTSQLMHHCACDDVYPRCNANGGAPPQTQTPCWRSGKASRRGTRWRTTGQVRGLARLLRPGNEFAQPVVRAGATQERATVLH